MERQHLLNLVALPSLPYPFLSSLPCPFLTDQVPGHVSNWNPQYPEEWALS